MAPALGLDTVVVPAQREGFERVFLGENAWYPIRIRGVLVKQLRYLAAYQSAPISAITHYATIDHIEPFVDRGGRSSHGYRVVFQGPPTIIEPIPYADALAGTIQSPRYTSLSKLLLAKRLMDVF